MTVDMEPAIILVGAARSTVTIGRPRELVPCEAVRTQRVGWLVLGVLVWAAQSASAQGSLSGLGRLAIDGNSIDDSHVPLAQRVAHARALGRLGEEVTAVSILTATLARRPAPLVRDAVVMSLAERRSALAAPELLRALRARIGSVSLIFDALAAIGGVSVTEALAELVEVGDRTQRDFALRALARTAPSLAAPLLLHAMSDTDVALRLSAFRIASEQPNALWTEPLAQALMDGSTPIDPSTITWSLARVPNGGGLHALLNVASHGVPLHCAVAIVACLHAYRDSVGADLVARSLLILRREAVAAPALEWLAHENVAHAVVDDPERFPTKAQRVELRRALRAVGPEAASARAAAALELASVDDPRSHVPLTAALADADVTVRRAAVRALAIVDRDEARAALLRFAALEPDMEVATLALAGARREPIALEDPWQSARSLLPRAGDPSVDRGVLPLAR
jgi:HEAT repeat protein